MEHISTYMMGFGFNFLIAYILVKFIYCRNGHDSDFIFTFITFNSVVYLVMSVLSSVELSIGVGFGLFALFSLLRYRTDTIPIKEMTYLFVIIALPIINALFFGEKNLMFLIVANASILLVIFLLENGVGFTYLSSQVIQYEKIENITPQNRQVLIDDIQTRTGFEIVKLQVEKIDFMHDTANVRIFYRNSRC